MESNERPTGILRTLPYFGASDASEAGRREAYKKMLGAFKRLEAGGAGIWIAMANKPKHDVLHCYIVVGNQVRVRANIAGYSAGNNLQFECWDGELRRANFWAVLTSPVSWPPEPIKIRGFQGFRYVTVPLW